MIQVHCAQCGQSYEPVASIGNQCPACLISEALPLESRTELRTPAFAAPKVSELVPYFEQLEIVELIGCGGMSAVYKAVQKTLGRTVALKILPEQVAGRKGGLERFQREAKLLAELNHPNIVHVYLAAQAGPWFYILMEYVAGANLRQLLGESTMPPNEVLRIASEICDALQYSHERSIVHRDIKPENVLLNMEGQVKLVDFGLAKSFSGIDTESAGSATQAGQVVGTPHYLAPEQMEIPGNVDHRADLYSLGILVYEMLTGELPLGNFAPPSQCVPSDAALDQVVLKAMSRDRSRRHSNASELRASLQDAIATSSDTDQLKAREKIQADAMKEASTNSNEPPTRQTDSATRLSDQSALRSPAVQRLWELWLSCCSLLAGFVGFVGTGNLLDQLLSDRKEPSEQILFGGSLMTFVAGLAWILGFVFARLNLSNVTQWSQIRWSQLPSLIPLVAAYALTTVLIVLGPSLAFALLANVPRFTTVDDWTFMGVPYLPEASTSFESAYWLQVYGAMLVTGLTWNLTVLFLLRRNSDAFHVMFHPMSASVTRKLLQRTCASVAITCLVLLVAIVVAFGFSKSRSNAVVIPPF